MTGMDSMTFVEIKIDFWNPELTLRNTTVLIAVFD